MRCFHDFGLGGGLCHIFANIYRYKAENNIPDTTIEDDYYTQMTKYVFEKLLEQKILRLPTPYIRPEVGHDIRERIIDVFNKYNCEITEDINLATHIIHPEVIDQVFPTEDSRISIEVPLKTWHVAAQWVFHSRDRNEFINECDYEVDENGVKLVQQYSPQDYSSNVTDATKTTTKKRSESVVSVVKAKKARMNASKNALPKTQCPVCEKTIAEKALKRHMNETHREKPKEFECEACESSFTRNELLMKHMRSIHFEPVKMGRPKKNEECHRRRRSPFKKDDFENRHGSSVEMLRKNSQMVKNLDANTEQLTEFRKILEQTKNEQKKNEERLKNLEKAKLEIRKVKTRVTMIESKQIRADLPDLKNIDSVLQYFNLTNNCTKTDVNDTINLRLMEISPESTVSREIYNNMTEEEKQDLSTFLNKASGVLLHYVKNRNKPNLLPSMELNQ